MNIYQYSTGQQVNPISHGIFFPWLPQGGKDSANNFGTLVLACHVILTSFEMAPLI